MTVSSCICLPILYKIILLETLLGLVENTHLQRVEFASVPEGIFEVYVDRTLLRSVNIAGI